MLGQTRFLAFVFTLLCCSSIYAFEPTFFARIIVEKPTIVKGDSTLVSVVLYSDGNFVDARCKSGNIKLKKCQTRYLSNNKRHRTGQAIWHNKRYNTLLWAQYVVKSEKTGKIKFPAQKFTATIRYYQRSVNPFAELWGQRSAFKDFIVKCKTEDAFISITEKPKRNTKTIIDSGAPTI